MSTDQPPLPEDPALLQHLLLEAQAEITRLHMLIAVLLHKQCRDRISLHREKIQQTSGIGDEAWRQNRGIM